MNPRRMTSVHMGSEESRKDREPTFAEEVGGGSFLRLIIGSSSGGPAFKTTTAL